MIEYSEILNKLPIIIYVNAPNAVDVTFYNEEWYSYTGFTQKDVSNGWNDVVHPDDIKRVLEIINKAVEKKEPYSLEVRLKNKQTGTYKWFLSRCTPIIHDNELVAWVGTSTDINLSTTVHKRIIEGYNTEKDLRLNRIKELESELETHKSLTD